MFYPEYYWVLLSELVLPEKVQNSLKLGRGGGGGGRNELQAGAVPTPMLP